MKQRILTGLLAAVLTFTLAGCTLGQAKTGPNVVQMRDICELAVMECYYHNVAKYKKEKAEGLIFKKDKRFWVEYSSRAKFGVRAEKIKVEVEDNTVSITMPQAELLDFDVDENSVTKDSYVIAKDCAQVTMQDCNDAIRAAQEKKKADIAADSAMLKMATQRAKDLLKKYVDGIGEMTGTSYQIVWNDVDAEGRPLDAPADTPAPTAAPTEPAPES